MQENAHWKWKRERERERERWRHKKDSDLDWSWKLRLEMHLMHLVNNLFIFMKGTLLTFTIHCYISSTYSTTLKENSNRPEHAKERPSNLPVYDSEILSYFYFGEALAYIPSGLEWNCRHISIQTAHIHTHLLWFLLVFLTNLKRLNVGNIYPPVNSCGMLLYS